jgi:hypothetical protein
LYFQELIDVGEKQVALKERQAKQWFQITAKAFPKVGADLVAVEGLIAPAVATPVLPRVEVWTPLVPAKARVRTASPCLLRVDAVDKVGDKQRAGNNRI